MTSQRMSKNPEKLTRVIKNFRSVPQSIFAVTQTVIMLISNCYNNTIMMSG